MKWYKDALTHLLIASGCLKKIGRKVKQQEGKRAPVGRGGGRGGVIIVSILDRYKKMKE